MPSPRSFESHPTFIPMGGLQGHGDSLASQPAFWPAEYPVEMQPGVPSWDEYFLEICRTVSRRSKDPNTKLGSVVVGPAHEIRATGYNSLVRGIRDDLPERLVRPEKYLWMEHAERNAIYNAARHGVQMEGCTLYVELLPCMDCARAVVQAGIREVVVDGNRVRQYWSEQYTPHFEHIRTMFREAGVLLRSVPPIEETTVE